MKKGFLAILALTLTLVLPVAAMAGCKSSAATTAAADATFAFEAQPAGATAGVAFTTQPVVAVLDINGNVDTTYTGTVTLALTPGYGTSGANLTGTVSVNAVAGVATFTNLAIDTAGTGYALTASNGVLLATLSATFDVAAATTTPTTTG